jgi:hypothetical protein
MIRKPTDETGKRMNSATKTKSVNITIGWKVTGMDGIDYRVIKADYDKGTYLLGELDTFDEESKYGPLHPQAYTSTCLVYATDLHNHNPPPPTPRVKLS